MRTELFAGFSRILCLPDDPVVHMAGGDAKSDRSIDGVLDEIAVTCIALRQSDNIYLIYTCDIVTISDFYTATKQMVTEATGIPPEHIILNATHTHSAPTLKHDLPGRDAYLAKFHIACVDAAVSAIRDLSPATLSYGSAQTENMVNIRHYWMNDGTSCGNGHGSRASGYKAHMYDADQECQVLKLTRRDPEKKDIVLINLASHATICSGKDYRTRLSADFPYYARTYVEKNADAHCAYFIAAGGDATPGSRVGRSPYGSDPNAFGSQVGKYVLTCLDDMTEAQGNDIILHNERYTAKRMKEGLEDPVRLAHAREILELRTKHGSYKVPEVKEKITEYGFRNVFEATGLVIRSRAPETDSLTIHAMTIGNVGLIFFPGELFSTYGIRIKENSPMDFTFIISCSEDHRGYFPNDIACEHRFYEYGNTKFARGTGAAVADRYCEIFSALKEGNTPAPPKMP